MNYPRFTAYNESCDEVIVSVVNREISVSNSEQEKIILLRFSGRFYHLLQICFSLTLQPSAGYGLIVHDVS
jgi:hypothetical protein